MSSRRTRTYTITRSAQNGGMNCPSANGATSSEPCQSAQPVNCVGSWGPWGACMSSRRTRTYTITRSAQNGGMNCPSANGATTSETCQSAQPVNCVGSWGAWGACTARQEKRTYTRTIAAANGGTDCTKAHGAIETRTCQQPVNCVGSWGTWGPCIAQEEKRTYTRTTVAANGGADCSKADGATETRTCDPSLRKDVDWKYAISQAAGDSDPQGHVELPIVVCPKGGVVTFRWSGSHNVWRLPTESAYVRCAFADRRSAELAENSSSSYVFSCTDPGTHFFACSMQDACQLSQQRIRVQVVDPSRAAALKTTVDAVTGEVVPTMASIMENDIADVDYNGFSSDAHATAIVERLESAMRHSPTSCSDWIPAHLNSNDTCVAALASDLGFVMRARPTPNAQASREYYALSLRHDASHCGTLSYLAELEVKEIRMQEATDAAEKACTACGPSIDVLLLAQSFKGKSWTLPASCLTVVPREVAHDSLSNVKPPSSGLDRHCDVSTLVLSLMALVALGSL